jgi:c-di-GMP-binding flagellar brake protein YcgR
MAFSFLGFGKKKPKLKLEPKTEVELEFVNGDEIQNYFSRVVSIDKKKIVVQIPTQNKMQVPVNVGDNLTVTYMDADNVYSFQARVLDARDREMELSVPTDIREEKMPLKDENFTLDLPIPVEYRAMSTAHLQTATTRSIHNNGVDILTNLPIPPNTSLHIELEIPNSPAIKTQGRVTTSKKLPNDKKSLTQIEFEDISPVDRETILRYAIYFQQRKIRKEALLQQE